jgi:hypothetical protein
MFEWVSACHKNLGLMPYPKNEISAGTLVVIA